VNLQRFKPTRSVFEYKGKMTEEEEKKEKGKR